MKPIRVNFKPSFIACVLFAAVTISALCIVMLQTFAWQIKLIACVMIAGMGVYTICQHGLLVLHGSCVAILINQKNQIQLLLKDDRLVEVTLLPNSVMTTSLTILNGQPKEAFGWQRLLTHHILIFADCVDAEQYRQLRVWLRWGYPAIKLNARL